MTAALPETLADAIARLYDLDLAEDPGDVDLYLAVAQRTGGPILELAVGTGRIALPLALAGHRVVGLDLDPAMLARARERAQAATETTRRRLELVEGDIAVAPAIAAIADNGPYRMAFLGLNTILLLPSPDLQRAAFASMAAVLAPGGVAVVDTWLPTPADLVGFDGRLSLEWLRTDPETGREVTKTLAAWYDPVSRRVTMMTIFEEGAPGQPAARWIRQDALRLPTVDELVSFAEAAGLEVETLAGDHDLGPLEPGSDRVILVARKPVAG